MEVPDNNNEYKIQVPSLTVEEVMKIAEEEIKRTSEEAVKAALLETGSELAYEKEKAILFQKQNKELELYNIGLQKEVEELKRKNRNSLFTGALLGGTGGVIITSIVYFLCSSFIK